MINFTKDMFREGIPQMPHSNFEPIDLESEVEAAVEGLRADADWTGSETGEGRLEAPSDAAVADQANQAADRIVKALEGGGKLETIRANYMAAAEAQGVDASAATASLVRALERQHRIREALIADADETDPEAVKIGALAAEIDSFKRSLDQGSEIRTKGGFEYVAKLAAGGFSSREEAMNALEDVKEGVPADDEEAQSALNAEFNLLYAQVDDHFGKIEAAMSGSGENPFVGDLDSDLDDAFGNLTGERKVDDAVIGDDADIDAAFDAIRQPKAGESGSLDDELDAAFDALQVPSDKK